MSVLALTALLAAGGIASATAWGRATWSAAFGVAGPGDPGDTVTVYGPRRFTTPTGSSTIGVERFTLAVQPNHRYLLQVSNGAADGTLRATTLSVALNGRTILTETDLGGARMTSRIVQPLADDTLRVTLSGPAGAYADVSLLDVADPTFLVFGPHTFIREQGSPTTEILQFSTAGGAGPYWMCVKNGNPDGTLRVSSATVLLNGVEIISEAELNQQVGGFMKQVTLQENNTLEVRVASIPSSRLTLCFSASDVVPPTLTIATPAPRLVTKESQVAVTGTVQDQTATKVTVENSVATRNGDAYSATVTLNAEGENVLHVSAVDAAGNRTDSTRTVIRDTQAPVIALASPLDGTITNQAQVTVTGTVQDLTLESVNVNGVPVTVGAGGAFTTPLSLVEGANFITVTATDEAGNSSSTTHRVTLDTDPPTLLVSSPADRALTNQTSIATTGTSTDATSVTVLVNGVPVSLGAGGSFSTGVPLGAEGDNVLTYEATDAAGNRTTVTRTVIRDTEAPVLSIATPADSQITNAPVVAVSGTITDRSAVTVRINGTDAPVDAEGGYSGSVTLTEGASTITVVATDAAGNTSTVTRTRILDTRPPVVTITAPSGRFVTKDGQVALEGRVTDETAVTLKLDTATVPLAADGSFSTTAPLTTEGQIDIVLVATDAAGNEGSGTAAVIRDVTPPTVTITSPASGFITKNQTVHVTGTVIDQTAVMVDINGVPLPVDQTGAFSGDVPLPIEGLNALLVRATDEATNSSAPARDIIRDTQAPVITVTAPTDGAVIPTSSTTVTGRVTDATATTLTVNGAPTTLASDGIFSATVALVSGANTITLLATDAASNSATDSRSVMRRVVDPDIPPDPATIAPSLDRTVPTLQITATEFLYTGSNPTQKGVAPGAIDSVRGATIRGKVLTKAYEPLMGVDVRIRNHPEYGTTKTREDGTFDFVVNGGGPLLVDFAKSTYLPAQRTAEVPWHEFAVLDSVIMLQLDPQVTTVDLASQTIQVAQGTVQQDADGQRQATVFLEPGTQATMVMPDGSRQPLTTMSLRLTEYTTGPTGPAAMPAVLPPSSMFTYAFQITADEAIAAGASMIELNKPTPVYVQNFLQFPAGTIVPVGALDVTTGAWVAQDNGTVITVLDVEGGVAAVDANGDGVADSDSALTALGLDLTERQTIATTFQPGASLWRLLPTKYWPLDGNWPGYAIGSDPQGDVAPGCASRLADPIRCDIQVARQSIGITGTPLSLVYGSDRSAGGNPDRTITVSLTGPSISPDLKHVDLRIRVAGRSFAWTFAPQPNLIFPFTWDGKDAYGRLMQGKQPISVDIGHVYPMVYTKPATDRPRAFGEPCNGSAGGDASSCNLDFVVGANGERRYRPRWQHITSTIGGWDAKALGLGGFTLSNHHTYDPIAQVLYQGDGQTRAAKRIPEVITTVAGRGSSTLSWIGYRYGYGEFSGDGGPAINAQFFQPFDVSVGPDGSIYVADQWSARYRKVATNGIITTVSGNGVSAHNNVGENDLATKANHYLPELVLAAPDGGFFVSDYADNRVRRITPDGKIHNFAGVVFQSSFSGDGGLATLARFRDIGGMALGSDGSLYISDRGSHRVRRVTPDGIVNTIAGNGTDGDAGDGGPALQARLQLPSRMAVGPDGSVYVVTGLYMNKIRRITPGGIITTVVGGGTANQADGALATSVSLDYIGDVKVAPNGTIYFQRRTGLYFVQPSNGRIYTVFPNNGAGPVVEGAIAAKAKEPGAMRFSLAPDGAIYLVLQDSGRIRRIAPPMPSVAVGQTAVAAPTGDMIYVFDANGRHVRTLNTVTGASIWTFAYDVNGALVEVTDVSGNTTRIERDGIGTAVAVVAPTGQRTVLGMNGLDLASITGPGNVPVRTTIGPNGLLSEFADESGRTTQYVFDSAGALTRMTTPDSNTTAIVATPSQLANNLEIRSSLGVVTVVQAQAVAPGVMQATVRLPNKTTVQVTSNADGSVSTRTPDGATATVTQNADPRVGMQSPLQDVTVTTPAGRSLVRRRSVAVLRDTNDPTVVAAEVDSTVINGRAFVASFDRRTLLETQTLPSGRRSFRQLDSAGRIIKDSIPGLVAAYIDYDSTGRLKSMRQGERIWRYGYDDHGRLASFTDPLGITERFRYNAADRLIERDIPNGTERYAYDDAGLLTSFTPVGRSAHTFDYTSTGSLSRYSAPGVAPSDSTTRYEYDADGRPTALLRADNSRLTMEYDSLGRRTATILPEGRISFAYDATSGLLKSVSTPQGESLTYTYDGKLPTSLTWAGPVRGAVGLRFDNFFRPDIETINGGSSVSFAYTVDGALRTAGALTVTRDSLNGLPIRTDIGSVSTTTAYDSMAQLSAITAAVGGNAMFGLQYTRDLAGRIRSIDENVAGSTTTFAFAYDSAGRLTVVSRNGEISAVYKYDDNGNRVLVTNAGGSTAGGVDAQDRLTTYGAATFSHAATGERLSKVQGSDTTRYRYSSLGDLIGLQLPNGTVVDYVLDGENRRVGKKINGVLSQGFLYRGALAPAVELDGNNQIVSRFVYATRDNVPDYMVRGGKTYRFILDHLGSVRLVVDVQSGELAQRIDYDEFGQVTQDTRPGFQPFGFAGGIYDQHSHLTRFGSRDYDALTGRWLEKDPLMFDGGDGNLYSYVHSDPVNRVDPTGLTETTTSLIVSQNASGHIASVLQTAALRTQLSMYNLIARVSAEHLAIALEAYAIAYENWGYLDYLGNQWHHIIPVYLGGLRDGLAILVPAPIHQYITNEFRKAHGYGQPKPSDLDLARILTKVYSKVPLAPPDATGIWVPYDLRKSF